VFSPLKLFCLSKIPPEKKIRKNKPTPMRLKLQASGGKYRESVTRQSGRQYENLQRQLSAKPLLLKNREISLPVDETVIKINGKKRFLWATINVE